MPRQNTLNLVYGVDRQLGGRADVRSVTQRIMDSNPYQVLTARSFGSYSVFGMNGISFRSFWSRLQNEQNGRNAAYSELTEYAFFWEIFGGKSYAAANVGPSG